VFQFEIMISFCNALVPRLIGSVLAGGDESAMASLATLLQYKERDEVTALVHRARRWFRTPFGEPDWWNTETVLAPSGWRVAS
jgi:hypothetical protein